MDFLENTLGTVHGKLLLTFCCKEVQINTDYLFKIIMMTNF